jgi:hypothetical protein
LLQFFVLPLQQPPVQTLANSIFPTKKTLLSNQGCQMFLGPNIPKTGLIYQMTTNYSK